MIGLPLLKYFLDSYQGIIGKINVVTSDEKNRYNVYFGIERESLINEALATYLYNDFINNISPQVARNLYKNMLMTIFYGAGNPTVEEHCEKIIEEKLGTLYAYNGYLIAHYAHNYLYND